MHIPKALQVSGWTGIFAIQSMVRYFYILSSLALSLSGFNAPSGSVVNRIVTLRPIILIYQYIQSSKFEVPKLLELIA